MKRNGLHACALATSAAIIIAVFAAGQTFGQRCAKSFERGSEDWAQCVDRLERGGEI